MNPRTVFKSVLLIIFDGFGIAPVWGGNAISVAKMPNFTYLWRSFPHAVLKASGKSVGLSGHEMGNSEVGHLNIGAGSIPVLDSALINSQIENWEFYENPILVSEITKSIKNGNAIHIIGLASNGGIHSHLNHLFATLELCQKLQARQVIIHAITDGRDSDPSEGVVYIGQVEEKIKAIGLGRIVTVSGRYFAMDRDKHWERTDLAVKAILGQSTRLSPSATEAISQSYEQGVTDEFVAPTIISSGSPNNNSKLKKGDLAIDFNFRSDRVRQLLARLSQIVPEATYVSFVPKGLLGRKMEKILTPFAPQKIETTLGEEIAKTGRQFRIAETEKFAHVTYFFNGGQDVKNNGEDRMLIPSLRVPSYDTVPEMRAEAIANHLIKKIRSHRYQLLVANFANPDMVGHTGNFKETVNALEFLDQQLGKIVKSCVDNDIAFILTADHGNAEQLNNPINGEIDTSHTDNPVPFILMTNPIQPVTPEGKLSDIAPTVLQLLGSQVPSTMTGQTLIVQNPLKNLL